jgi:hypothetical protein
VVVGLTPGNRFGQRAISAATTTANEPAGFFPAGFFVFVFVFVLFLFVFETGALHAAASRGVELRNEGLSSAGVPFGSGRVVWTTTAFPAPAADL